MKRHLTEHETDSGLDSYIQDKQETAPFLNGEDAEEENLGNTPSRKN